MGEWFRQIPSKIVEFWNKYTAKQKTLFFSVAAAVIITIVALVLILNRTDYVTISSFESTAAASSAAELLKSNNITYRVSKDALTIEVDSEQESDARLLLGANGISTTVNQTDYDWLFDNSFNTTDSERRLKQKINLQSEMSATIAHIDGVSAATVTINIPDNTNSIYATDESTSVSIMITTTTTFDKNSVNTIVEYAKGCVGNSDTEDITLIDNQGNLLYSGTNSSSTALNALSVEQQIEEYYSSKLWNLMVNSGVYDEVSASANLDVNISPTEIRNIEYYSNDEDDTGPKDTYYYYVAENTDGSGDVVGTDANDDEVTDYDLLDNGSGESNLSVIKETYSTSSTETVSSEAVGEVNLDNSSIALYLTKYEVYEEAAMEKQGLLDDISFTEFQTQNSETIETTNNEQTVALLANATGIDEGSIYVVERIVPLFYPKEEEKVPVRSIITIVLAVLIAGLLLFVVFKSMKPAAVVEEEPELSVEALLATTRENQNFDEIEFSDKSGTRVQIEKFVDENPEAVAALLRNWLNDEWE